MKRTIPKLPTTFAPDALVWARGVQDSIIQLPGFSIISTTDGPNTSGTSGTKGTLAIEVGSSATPVWVKRSGSTSTVGWSALSWI